MPYLISFAKWPSDKTVGVIKKLIEANKKFPPDESLGIDLTPGNAIKATKEGFETIGVSKVKEGKLKDAYQRVTAAANLYAMAIEGFEYKLEVWSTDEEAFASIGQKPPE